MSLTRKKLERFVKYRNKGSMPSNLQFMFDCDECGFKVDDLGDAKKLGENHYEWLTPFGTLTEQYGRLSLTD